MNDIFSKAVMALKTLITRHVTIECDHLPHEFYNVPFKKLLNWFLVETSMFIKPVNPWGWPTHMLIEPTNFCNLKCVLCPVTEGLNRPSGKMEFEIFQKLIDEVGEYIFLILLWDWGEPFLNPRVYDMIAYAKKRNIQVISSTNGHQFTNKANAEKLVKSGIDSLIFAVDGITQQTYEQYRHGGNLDKVLTGIKNVVAAKQRLNSITPLLNFRFIAMKHNEHEITKLPDFTEQLGIDVLTVRTLCSYDEGETCVSRADGNNFLPDNSTYQRFTETRVTNSRKRRRNNPCKTLWNNPAIHWDGKVCPCTFDPHERQILGDFRKETFKEVWFGTAYQTYRRKFRKNYQQLILCSKCTNAFEGGSCGTEDIVESYFFNK